MKIKLASLAKFWLLQNRTFELFCRIGTRETGIKEKQKKVSPSWQSCFKSNTTTLDHKVERSRAITAFTKFLALLLKLWRRFLIFYRSNQPAKASIGPLLKDHYHPSRLLLLQHQRQLSLRAQEHNSLMPIKFDTFQVRSSQISHLENWKSGKSLEIFFWIFQLKRNKNCLWCAMLVIQVFVLQKSV